MEAKCRRCFDLTAVERGTLTRAVGRIDVLKGDRLRSLPASSSRWSTPSGAGKSTLLHIQAFSSAPTAARSLSTAIERPALRPRTHRMRRMEIGFVYQFHHLLPEFTALENVVMPQPIPGLSRDWPRRGPSELLALLRFEERWRPSAGGTIGRRAAACRHRPGRRQPARFCSPTSPPATSTRITAGPRLRPLLTARAPSGVAALIATHNLDLAARMDRTLRLSEGRLVEEEVVVTKAGESRRTC